MLASISAAESESLPTSSADLQIYDLLRYHLGYLNEHFQPVRSDAGKRVRPRLVMLVNAAFNGMEAQAIHTAAAIELLHNFTLIHDDIQDESPLRRHRPTVWSLWGVPQAINAGDAMFAVAHLALNRSLHSGVDAMTTLRLSNALHQTTLRIVEGQTLDIGFEQRGDVTANEYVRMIGGKTSAITRLACWGGAIIAGVDDARADACGEFGFALGIGFQVQDDWLGVWGDPARTGKAAADDIRRRKKAFPALLLHDRAVPEDRSRIDELYSQPSIEPGQIDEILDMMRRYEVATDVQAEVKAWHDRAADALTFALPANEARDELLALVESLGNRSG
jgi:geranylgeranyl diphosphate synthase type I